MRLYWATTDDGFEDWFVVAKSKTAAERFHEDAEGFNRGDAKAEFICSISDTILIKYENNDGDAFWPRLDFLKKLGGQIINKGKPRSVNFNGKVYREGGSIEKILLNVIKNKPGLYVANIQRTRKYKVGITKNISRRLKQLATGNPFNLKLVYFVETLHYISLEKLIFKTHKKNRINGEWFSFAKNDLKNLEVQLRYIAAMSDQFKFINAKEVLNRGDFY